MSRKGENIYKRKDGRWEGRYIKEHDERNKAKYGYVYAYSYKEVKTKLNNAIYASKGTKRVQSVSIEETTLNIIVKDWFLIMQPQYKESTKMKYFNLLNSYIIPFLGYEKIKDLTVERVKFFCNNLLTHGGKQKQGLSSKTVSDTLSLLKSILKYASSKGICVPSDLFFLQIKREQKTLQILSRNDQQKLCEYLFLNNSPYNRGILLCLFTGLRIGEVCALEWKDISFADKTIYVHQTMQRVQSVEKGKKTRIIITTPKSPCSIRIIPIPSKLAKIIDCCNIQKTGYFLTNSNTIVEPRTMQRHLKKVLQETSISPINFHALRHTFATRCVELGFDIKSLSVILGHSNVNITMNRYVHPTLELKQKNMQLLSDLITVK